MAHRPRKGALSPAQLKRRRTLKRLAYTKVKGRHLRLPPDLKGSSPAARERRAAWEEAQHWGQVAKSHPSRSPEAVRALVKARAAQEQLARSIGTTLEELIAAASPDTAAGRRALALIRY
jgi:hypothetical protein